MRYILYGQGLTRKTVFDNRVAVDKMATIEIFRNMDNPFENFIIIKFKL